MRIDSALPTMTKYDNDNDNDNDNDEIVTDHNEDTEPHQETTDGEYPVRVDPAASANLSTKRKP